MVPPTARNVTCRQVCKPVAGLRAESAQLFAWLLRCSWRGDASALGCALRNGDDHSSRREGAQGLLPRSERVPLRARGASSIAKFKRPTASTTTTSCRRAFSNPLFVMANSSPTRSVRSLQPRRERTRSYARRSSTSSRIRTSGASASCKDAALLTLAHRSARARARHVAQGRERLQRAVPGRPSDLHRHAVVRAARREARPWVAYRQFCQHFLAPLALMSLRRRPPRPALATHLDGVPLDLASRLLPRHTWLRPGLAMHLHWHARAQRHYAGGESGGPQRAAAAARVTSVGMLGILQSLERAIEGMTWSRRAPSGRITSPRTDTARRRRPFKRELVVTG